MAARPRHLFVIDPLAQLNLQLDSSLRLMAALFARDQDIYICEPRHLSWMKVAGATALAQRLRFQSPKNSVPQFVADPEDVWALGDFAAIHMRKDPPYDLDYIATTWVLDAAPPSTRIYNAPAALRSFNEKLAIMAFKDEARPALLSAQPEALLAFATEHAQGDAVLKPLTLFGGRGVFRLQVSQGSDGEAKALELLRKETGDGQSARLIQAFDPGIFAGEVRVFSTFGEPVAWCLKKPAAGEFLANTRAGASLAPYSPQPEEVTRINRVARHLLRHGIVFIGFDVISGFISEINITSPRLLVGPGDDTDHYGHIAARVIADLEA